jgi:MoaA/NifB/PqqE/SkfB family radical SAM enzyme
MKSVVITPKNKEELVFVNSLLKKLGISSKLLTIEEVEDFGLGKLMKEANRSKKDSKNIILKKLS